MPGTVIHDPRDAGWIQVARGVFYRRYDPMDVSVGVIVGSDGITVVDTRNNPTEAREVLRDVAEEFALPISAAVNTHAHYDHSFGNQVFVDRGIPVYGHRLVPQHFTRHEGPRLRKVQQQPDSEPDKAWGDVTLTPPTMLVDAPLRIAPGGREIELFPLLPGHTDTDLAVLVSDVRVWLLGDVIEESGPPMFGSGPYPLNWPDALDALLSQIRTGDAVVPGHGTVIDRDAVAHQASLLRAVAAQIRSSYAARTLPDEVDWERSLRDFWPESFLRSAAAAGYAQLSATVDDARDDTESDDPEVCADHEG